MNELNNKNPTEIPSIVNASEHHMALLFLIDTSKNMGKRDKDTLIKPISELTDALNRFKYEVCKDEHTKDILDVAIVSYDNEYRVIQDFSPVEYLNPLKLETQGEPFLCSALDVALDMVTERSRFYRRAGAEPYKPWVVIITNEMTMDEPYVIDNMIDKVNDLSQHEKVSVWTLLAGKDSDDRTSEYWLYHKLCGKRVLSLNNYDFVGFLDWTNKSMRAVSQSVPGDKIRGQNLPPSVAIDSHTAQVETAVSVAKCSRTGNLFGIRFFKKNNVWETTWAFPIRYEVHIRDQDRRIIENPRDNGEYPGCPYCGGKMIIQCECGQVSCGEPYDRYLKCKWCGEKLQIVSVDSIDLSGTNNIDL